MIKKDLYKYSINFIKYKNFLINVLCKLLKYKQHSKRERNADISMHTYKPFNSDIMSACINGNFKEVSRETYHSCITILVAA